MALFSANFYDAKGLDQFGKTQFPVVEKGIITTTTTTLTPLARAVKWVKSCFGPTQENRELEQRLLKFATEEGYFAQLKVDIKAYKLKGYNSLRDRVMIIDRLLKAEYGVIYRLAISIYNFAAKKIGWKEKSLKSSFDGVAFMNKAANGLKVSDREPTTYYVRFLDEKGDKVDQPTSDLAKDFNGSRIQEMLNETRTDIWIGRNLHVIREANRFFLEFVGVKPKDTKPVTQQLEIQEIPTESKLKRRMSWTNHVKGNVGDKHKKILSVGWNGEKCNLASARVEIALNATYKVPLEDGTTLRFRMKPVAKT